MATINKSNAFKIKSKLDDVVFKALLEKYEHSGGVVSPENRVIFSGYAKKATRAIMQDSRFDLVLKR